MKFVFSFIVCSLISLATAPLAFAESGVLNALSLRPLPDQKNIQVQVLDDSDENLQLQAELEEHLVAKGYTIVKKGDLILTFETRDQIGDWQSATSGHVISLEASGGRGGGENHKARVNVFDSSSGGLLNQNQGRKASSSTASQYRLDVTVESRADGKTLWRAWSVADLESGEGLTLTKKMVPLLVENIGQTIRSQDFTVE